MARICPLPADAISGIQSSKHITSLQGVVLSLLENSLDAGSSKVEISVDFRRGCCTIEDNGVGIASSEFLESGGLGKLYHTSKHLVNASGELHGSTGTYLASLGALSLLSITSRHESCDETATLTIHQGNVIARSVPAPAIDELTLSPSHGTRATVRDLFGSMPVRVKQRALQPGSGSNDEKAWQELKQGIVALQLAWPHPCSVKLCDVNDDKKKIKLSAQHPSVGTNLTEKSLKQLSGARTKFELKDVLPILFQAGLAPPENRTNWVPLSAASSHISVKGSICLGPAPTKVCQFISFGIHPCGGQDGYTDIYDTVNRLFSNSSFGAIEDDSVDIDDEEKDRRARDRRFKQDGFTQKQIQGRKGVDRWPMFVLQIKFKDGKERSDRVSEKSLKAMVEILEAAVRQWLEAHQFRPRKKRLRKQSNREHSPEGLISHNNSGYSTPTFSTPDAKRTLASETVSTSKRRKVLEFDGRLRTVERERYGVMRPASADFANWSRIKSGNRTLYDELWEGKKPQTALEGQQSSIVVPAAKIQTPFSLPVIEAGELSSKKISNANVLRDAPTSLQGDFDAVLEGQSKLSSDYFSNVDEDALVIAAEQAEQEAGLEVADDTIVEWTDSATKETFRVNSRTGVVLPNRPKPQQANGTPTRETIPRTSAAINTSLTSAGLPITLSKRPSTASGDEKWLPGFLKEWQNPVFTRQDEESIPVAWFDGPGIDVEEAANKRCNHEAASMRFNQQSSDGTRKLSKTALRNAQVTQQVDRKFILCKLREAESEVLVLVDQHAASERVILEDLLSELCSPVDEATAQATGSRVKTVQLEKPLRFQISAAEYELLRSCSRHFADWGILYDLRQRHEELSASQVRPAKEEHIIFIRALPPGIAERCTLFPKLLIELLRTEIHSYSPTSKRTAKTTPDSAEETPSHSWLAKIGSCPRGILDMLNSRACRSAIMFNDHLSVEQCEELLRNLGECAFPFMCAHGRVSCVPVVELGTVGKEAQGEEAEGGHSEKRDGGKFSEAFKRWTVKESSVDRPENDVH